MFSAAFAIIGQFLGSKLGPPMFLVIGAVAALGWGLWYMGDQAYDRLLTESATKLAEQKGETRKAVDANVTLATANKELTDQSIQNKANRKIEEYKKAILIKERDDANKKYDSYRSRMAGVMDKKGSLIARRANAATRMLVGGLEAATCRTCGEGGANTQDSPTTEPAPTAN